MVVGIRKFIALVWNAGVKNKIRLFFNQPGNVAVRQLRRVAFGFAWDGIDAQFVNAARRLRGEQRAKFKAFEKYGPKREIFVHV